MKNLTIPLFTPPDRVNWVNYEARNDFAGGLISPIVNRALTQAGPHRIWLVYNPNYLTYQRLCPDLRLALAVQRPLHLWMNLNPGTYENEELDSFTTPGRPGA